MEATRSEEAELAGLQAELAGFALGVTRDAVLFVDADAVILEANGAACRLVGCSREQLLGAIFYEIDDCLDADSWAHLWEIAAETSDHVQVSTLIAPDGARSTVDLAISRGVVGGRETACLIAHDISDRVKAVRALRFSELMNASIIAAASECILTSDEGGGVLTINPAAERTFGIAPQAARGRPLERFIHWPDPGQRGALLADCANRLDGSMQAGGRFEVEGVRADGTRFPGLVSMAAIEIGGKLEFITYLTDITERRRVEEGLRQATEAARQASEFKSEFLASMSHEVRTPLTAIVSYSDLLVDESRSAEQRSDWGRRIHHNAHYAMSLVNDLLDLGKVEAGQYVMRHQSVDLPAIVGDLDAMFRPRAAEKMLAFHTEYETAIPVNVVSDPTMLRQIVANLLSNAIKFTESGSVSIRLRYDHGEWHRGDLTIECVDTGKGMNDEQQRKVFDPFVQVHDDRKLQTKGTGLGLSIAHKFARLMSGELTVRSDVGRGTTFSLRLPVEASQELVTPTADPLALPAVRPMSEAPRVPGMRVLVADDNPDNRRILRFLLEPTEAQLAFAEDGAEAVKAIADALEQGEPFALVFMDMQMPNVDGYEAARTIRATAADCTIVACTAFALPGDRDKCLAAGCDGYLTKPINTRELLAEVEATARERGLLNRESRAQQPAVADEPAVERTTGTKAQADANASPFDGLQDMPGFAELVDAFKVSLRESVVTLRTALAAGDFKKLKVISHRLKGTGSSYGFPEVTTVAAQCEQVVAKADPAAIPAAVEQLIAAAERAAG